MSPSRALIVFAALNGALAVAAGAFAAHGGGPQVKTLLATGAHYQMVHAVLAVACAGLGARAAGWLAAAGGLVFALALYAVGLIGLGAAGMIAPVGGLAMILGWLALAWRVLRPAARVGG